MTEWIVIGVGFIQFVFFIGMYFQKIHAKGTKVDTHDTKFSDFEDKFDTMATEVNSIKAESNSHKENISKVRQELNLFTASTNQRLEKFDKNQTVQMMLLFELCQKQGINTTMAEALMKE